MAIAKWKATSQAVCTDPCVKSDDVETFVETVKKRRQQYLRMAWHLTGNREEAEEIVQAALVKAFLNLHQFRGEATMNTWLWVIVKNTARNYGRGLRSSPFVPYESGSGDGELGVIHDFPDNALNPEERYERREMVELLREEIQRLDRRSREILEMCVLEEMPQKKVAQALKLTSAGVKSRIFRAKQNLAAAMTASCLLTKGDL